MQLGPIQKQWIANLKAYPERQLKDFLGEGSPKKYKACCLGELLVCKYKAQKKKLPFKDGSIYSGKSDDAAVVLDNYKTFGLFSSTGQIMSSDLFVYPEDSLAELNDNGYTWPEIAALVEANPEHFFIKSY